MKENLKNQLLILLYLFITVTAVFLCVLLMVLDIFWLLKIVVVLATIALTIYLFIVIKKTNKKLVYIEKEVTSEEINTEKTNVKKIRCPKCYNDYDGDTCFVCGYKKNENNAQ